MRRCMHASIGCAARCLFGTCFNQGGLYSAPTASLRPQYNNLKKCGQMLSMFVNRANAAWAESQQWAPVDASQQAELQAFTFSEQYRIYQADLVRRLRQGTICLQVREGGKGRRSWLLVVSQPARFKLKCHSTPLRYSHASRVCLSPMNCRGHTRHFWCEARKPLALPLPPRRFHAPLTGIAKPVPPQVFAGEDSLSGAERTRSGSVGAAPSAGNSGSGLNPHAHHHHPGHHASHAHDGSGPGSKPNSAGPGPGRTRAASLRRMDSGGSTSSGYSTPVGGTSMSGQRGGAGRGPLGFDLWTNDPWELVDRFRPGIMPQTDRIQVGRGLPAVLRA